MKTILIVAAIAILVVILLKFVFGLVLGALFIVLKFAIPIGLAVLCVWAYRKYVK